MTLALRGIGWEARPVSARGEDLLSIIHKALDSISATHRHTRSRAYTLEAHRFFTGFLGQYGS